MKYISTIILFLFIQQCNATDINIEIYREALLMVFDSFEYNYIIMQQKKDRPIISDEIWDASGILIYLNHIGELDMTELEKYYSEYKQNDSDRVTELLQLNKHKKGNIICHVSSIYNNYFSIDLHRIDNKVNPRKIRTEMCYFGLSYQYIFFYNKNKLHLITISKIING